MKICFFTGDSTRSGGTERVVSTLTEGLLHENPSYQIYILSLQKGDSRPFYSFNRKIIFKNLNVLDDMPPAWKLSKGVAGLRKFIKKNKIDVLVDVDTLLSVYSIPAIAFTEVKHISWEHFTFNQNLGVKYRDWGRKLAGRFSDAIVVLTEQDQQQYLTNRAIKRPVYHIYNPILLNENTIPTDDTEKKIILSAGRLAYQKGFDLLIDVAELVFTKHPNWQWIIAGEGEDRSELERKIKEKKLENHVILIGNVSNIEDYYQRAAIFVLTSRFEPFGLVLTEAKSFHLPCISFDVESGPAEIILDSINGYLIEPFDVRKMAEKINYLIEHPNIRKKQSDKAMADTDKFHVENITEKWGELFETVLNGTGQK